MSSWYRGRGVCQCWCYGGQSQGVATALHVSAVKWSPAYLKYSCMMAPFPSIVCNQCMRTVVPIARSVRPVMLSLLGHMTTMQGSHQDSRYLLTREKVSWRSMVQTALCSKGFCQLSSLATKTLYRVENGFFSISS